MKTLKKNNFKTVLVKKCTRKKNSVNITKKVCQPLMNLFHKNKQMAIEYAAKLNVPHIPIKNKRQLVLGTTKYLLPYLLLPQFFETFYTKPDMWILDKNMDLIECIAKNYIKHDIIRIITTPQDLVDINKNYRITAEEICVLKQYNYKFYKYISKEHNNIYFCSKTPLKDCVLIRAEDGMLKCKNKNINIYI